MAHGRGPFAATALCLGFTVSSCAIQPTSKPFIPEDAVQPTVLTSPASHQERHLSATGGDSDCVLSTRDIHLWCKRITRFY